MLNDHSMDTDLNDDSSLSYPTPIASGTATRLRVKSGGIVRKEYKRMRSRSVWPAYAAAIWAFLFALQSFYHAAGGTFGVHTFAQRIVDLGEARDPDFIRLVWATGVLKVLAGLLALSLVRPWGRLIPRRLLLIAVWGAGVFLVLYGGAGLIEAGLMEAGVIRIPESMGARAVRWYVLFWKPWWLLGGLLFILAARAGGRRRKECGPDQTM